MRDGAERVLIVEDSFMLAMEVELLVEECGCAPVGPVSNVADGLVIVRQTDLDAAILDINLGDERVWPVAELLHDRGVPFLLATGYSAAEVPPRFRDCLILEKPIRPAALRAGLSSLGLHLK